MLTVKHLCHPPRRLFSTHRIDMVYVLSNRYVGVSSPPLISVAAFCGRGTSTKVMGTWVFGHAESRQETPSCPVGCSLFSTFLGKGSDSLKVNQPTQIGCRLFFPMVPGHLRTELFDLDRKSRSAQRSSAGFSWPCQARTAQASSAGLHILSLSSECSLSSHLCETSIQHGQRRVSSFEPTTSMFHAWAVRV